MNPVDTVGPGWPFVARELRRCTAIALVAAAGCVGMAAPVAAHEYWLDPLDATITIGQPLFAEIRNGQDFVGDTFPFDPTRFDLASVSGPAGVEPLSGRLGDDPAIRLQPMQPGVFRVALETTDRSLTYDDAATFDEFARYHGLGDLLGRHRERGLPAEQVRERFARYATAFVDVRDAGGERRAPQADAEVLKPAGLLYELVPTGDPYEGNSLSLIALYEGRPREDAQVERFMRAPDGTVSRSVGRTDAQGRIDFDVGGAGDYLFNSVLVLEIAGEVPWRSLWASMVIERD